MTRRLNQSKKKKDQNPLKSQGFHEHVSEILPGLWLGDIESSYNIEFLKEHDIECIFNCTQTIPFPETKTVRYKYRVPVRDNLEQDQIDKLYQLLDTIVEKLHKHIGKSNILVHCHAGRQRSATVIVAYLMKYGGLSKNEAVKLLATKRAVVFTPMMNFRSAIDRYASLQCQLPPKSGPKIQKSS